jgi:hypothetical protein
MSPIVTTHVRLGTAIALLALTAALVPRAAPPPDPDDRARRMAAESTRQVDAAEAALAKHPADAKAARRLHDLTDATHCGPRSSRVHIDTRCLDNPLTCL